MRIFFSPPPDVYAQHFGYPVSAHYLTTYQTSARKAKPTSIVSYAAKQYSQESPVKWPIKQ